MIISAQLGTSDQRCWLGNLNEGRVEPCSNSNSISTYYQSSLTWLYRLAVNDSIKCKQTCFRLSNIYIFTRHLLTDSKYYPGRIDVPSVLTMVLAVKPMEVSCGTTGLSAVGLKYLRGLS